jgi:hypothetical protein
MFITASVIPTHLNNIGDMTGNFICAASPHLL